MPKTIKHVFDEKLTFVKLVEAHQRASNNKRNHRDVILFEMDLESNIANLLHKIKTNTYKMGKYHSFYVYEPKQRLIKSLPYVDRVVHQWYVEEFIKPYMLPRFISKSFACIEDRGAHKAVEYLQKYMRIMKRNYGSYYILKCDIKKYFYSIDRDILFQILSRYIRDPKLLDFTKLLIFDEDEKIGIPIGNYTSQYFANIYLNVLDHYVKEKLRVKYYLRYMDDFIILCKTKEEAKEYKDIIEKFINEKLHLEFNKKTRYYPSSMGVDFCGYKVFETHRLVRKRSKDKMRRRIRKWNKDYRAGVLNLKEVEQSWNAWLGHIKHANTYTLQNRYFDLMEFKDIFSEFLSK